MFQWINSFKFIKFLLWNFRTILKFTWNLNARLSSAIIKQFIISKIQFKFLILKMNSKKPTNFIRMIGLKSNYSIIQNQFFKFAFQSKRLIQKYFRNFWCNYLISIQNSIRLQLLMNKFWSNSIINRILNKFTC